MARKDFAKRGNFTPFVICHSSFLCGNPRLSPLISALASSQSMGRAGCGMGPDRGRSFRFRRFHDAGRKEARTTLTRNARYFAATTTPVGGTGRADCVQGRRSPKIKHSAAKKRAADGNIVCLTQLDLFIPPKTLWKRRSNQKKAFGKNRGKIRSGSH